MAPAIQKAPDVPKAVETIKEPPKSLEGSTHRDVKWIKPGEAVDESADDMETINIPGLKAARAALQNPPPTTQPIGGKTAVDQGKVGQARGIEVIARARGIRPSELGHTTFRPPFVPVTLGTMVARNVGDLYAPYRRSPYRP